MQNGEIGLEEVGGVTTPTADPTPKKVKGTNTRNPTVVAIARISAILDELDGHTRDTVAHFIAGQYCPEF